MCCTTVKRIVRERCAVRWLAHPTSLSVVKKLRKKFAGFHIEYGELLWGEYDLCFPIMDLYKNQIDGSQHTDVAA